MRLLIFRHGKSYKHVNEKGFPQIIGGDELLNPKLTEEGIIAAKKLGDILRQYDVTACYSSTLIRAIQTATTAIGSYMDEYDIFWEDNLKERKFEGLTGCYADEVVLSDMFMQEYDIENIENLLGEPVEGRSKEEYIKHVLYEINAPNIDATTILTTNHDPKIIESRASIATRIQEVERRLCEIYDKNDTIAISTHGDVTRTWLNLVMTNQERYDIATINMVKAIPSKGFYRKVDNCQLYEIVLV